MKAYVINLPRAPSRLEKFQANAKEHEWDVSVFVATDWRDLIFKDVSGYRIVECDEMAPLRVMPRRDYPQELAPGEIAS